MRRIVTTFVLAGAMLPASYAALDTPGRSLMVERWSISDNGDHDGFADPGETVELAIRVHNASGVTFTGMGAVLQPVDAALTCVTRRTIGIGTLAPGESRWIDETFEFHVSGDAQRTGTCALSAGGCEIDADCPAGASDRCDAVEAEFVAELDMATTCRCTRTCSIGNSALLN